MLNVNTCLNIKMPGSIPSVPFKVKTLKRTKWEHLVKKGRQQIQGFGSDTKLAQRTRKYQMGPGGICSRKGSNNSIKSTTELCQHHDRFKAKDPFKHHVRD